MRDLKTILALLLLAIMGLAFIFYVYGPVSAADNLTVNATPTPTLVQMVNTFTPTPTPIPPQIPVRVLATVVTPRIVPIMMNSTAPNTTNIPYYVQQGSTVYLGDTVDISGIMAGVFNMAYYGGYDEESGEQFLLDTPNRKIGYYRYYIDPAIFGSRLGKWYKWNGYVERQANNLIFVVAETRPKTNLSENSTLQNPNQTPIVLPKVPLLPDQHIADYLIARGDSMDIPATNQTKAWIFGSHDSVYDFMAVNGTIQLKDDILDKLSPGTYQLLLQTRQENATGDFTVRYNQNTSMIDWFDPQSFAVQHYDTAGQTPENVMNKLKSLIPAAHDTYKIYTLEIQTPTVTINQIDTTYQLNSTVQNQGVSLDSPGFLDVRGYSNAAQDTIVKVILDPDLNMDVNQMFKDGIATHTEGIDPGNMRVFKAIVPVQLYNMAPGKHFVAAKTSLSDGYVTADFYIYENPAGNFIPNKTIRYISGKYGPQEMIPTPTPIIVTQVVTKVVTQIVTVPVTPSNEQIYVQQKIASEKTWWEGATRVASVVGGGIFLIGGIWYGVYTYRRAKDD
jgi:hypothetical protein